MNTSDLNKVLISNWVHFGFISLQFWKIDMDWCSKSSSKIGWAWCNIAKVIVMSKFANSLNMCGSSAESVKDFLDSCSLLHGDDSELIFFVDPDEETLCIVMENTSTWWPISIKVTSSEILVTFLEKEMVSDQLILISFRHAFERIKFTLQITFKRFTSLDDKVHNLKSLFLGNTWTKWECCKVSSNSDSCWVNHSWIFLGEIGISESCWAHIRDMAASWVMSVIV